MAGNAFFDPRVARHLIADEGEVVIDEVRRHPMAFVVPLLITIGGALIMLGTLWFPVALAWLPLLVGLVVTLIGGYKMLAQHMDRFVITNMRVFRVHGIFSQHIATMPMSRILDISVHKPFIGRIFGYGHFVFESAAQDQGLRDIRYVGHPDRRDLTIQRVIQRSGLRSSVQPLTSSGAGTAATPNEVDDHDPTDGSSLDHPASAWSARDEADHLRARENR
jgi:membrane protein YdbS with pleckstrin-like domain